MTFRGLPAVLVGAGVLLCAGCAGLPPVSAELADGPLRLVRDEAKLRLRVAPDWQADGLSAPRLSEVVVDVAPDLLPEASASQVALIDPVREAFARTAAGPLQLTIRIGEIKPVSPALNVLSTALLLWPLDTGSLRITATVRDADGRVVAVRDERIHGHLRDLGKAFDPYAHLHAALLAWSARCAQWPQCFSAASPQP